MFSFKKSTEHHSANGGLTHDCLASQLCVGLQRKPLLTIAGGNIGLNKPLHSFFASVERPPEQPGRMAPCPPAAFRFGLFLES